MGGETNILHKRIPNNLCTLPKRTGSISPHSSSVGYSETCYQRLQYEKGMWAKGRNLINTTQVRRSSFTSTLRNHNDGMYPGCDLMKMALYSLVQPDTSQIMRKTSHKFQWRTLLQHTRSVTLRTVKVIKTKDKSEKQLQRRGASGDIKTKVVIWYPGWDHGRQKATWLKKEGNLNKLGKLMMCQYWFIDYNKWTTVM